MTDHSDKDAMIKRHQKMVKKMKRRQTLQATTKKLKRNRQPKPVRKSNIDAAPLRKSHLPVILAKAEAVEPQIAPVDRTESVAPVVLSAAPEADRKRHDTALAQLEDTNDHAIDPNAAPIVGSDTIPTVAKAEPARDDAADAGESYPRWAYSLENDTEWQTSATLKITVTYESDPGSGTYYVKFIIPNGISDEYYFSM